MVSRREFLKKSSQISASLILSTYLPSASISAETTKAKVNFQPNIYLEIMPDNQVIFWVKKAEMGQLIHTALTQIAIDELGADLNTVQIKQAQSDKKFGNINTGGSWSVAGSYQPLRQIMAKARMMLTQAAMITWRATEADCQVENGNVINLITKNQFTFGDLAGLVSTLKEPKQAQLKPRSEFRYIGKSIPRLDNKALIQGQSQFGIDVQLPNMLYAVLVRPPLATCSLKSFDAIECKKVSGIIDVINLSDRVAVVASSQWAAIQGKKVLKVQWDFHGSEQLNNTELEARLDAALNKKGVTCRAHGTVSKPSANQDIVRIYYMPLAAHMPMEPPTATANVTITEATIWAPTQTASMAQKETAKRLGLPEEQVTVHTTLLGGSFGRKLERDFIFEAALLSQIMKKPIKVIWSREDDIQHGFLRACSKHKYHVKVDDNGYPLSYQVIAASPSVWDRDDPSQIKNGHDWSAVLGLTGMPYAVPNLRLSHQIVAMPEVLLTWWRGSYANNNCFAAESLIDELAVAAQQDPLTYRLALLRQNITVPNFPGEKILINHQRLKRVLKKAAQMMKWRKNLKPNQGHGIACHCYDSNAYAAHVIEVEVVNKQIKIIRVTCAFDIGLAINPDGVKAQLEGSIIFGLTSALQNNITFSNGQIEQTNFDDQPVMRINETPTIEIELFSDGDTPGGVGECGLPSVTPALLNAIFDACGKRIRNLPVKL